MSGTEAVMQAVRLARYHTGRTHLVRFCGAYHGWWGDVQPGVGNPLAARETYTLKDMDPDSLRVLRTAPRYRLRAGQSAAGVASQRRRAGRLDAHRQRTPGAFRPRRLRRMARAIARGVQRAGHRADFRRSVRRLPPWHWAARRNTSACAPTWSPTARRWPAGSRSACCAATRKFMRRFREDRPADICFARGTFNSHPYVMGAMCEFLTRLETEPYAVLYRDLDDRVECARAGAQRTLGGRAAARARRQPVLDLDDLLPAAVAL